MIRVMIMRVEGLLTKLVSNSSLLGLESLDIGVIIDTISQVQVIEVLNYLLL